MGNYNSSNNNNNNNKDNNNNNKQSIEQYESKYNKECDDNKENIVINNKSVCNGTLEIKKYPLFDIKKWIPIEAVLDSKQNRKTSKQLYQIKGIDGRVRAKPSDYALDIPFYGLDQIYNIGRLRMEFEYVNATGTGSIIYCSSIQNEYYILTCAHNVVIADDDDEDGQLHYVKAIWFEINKNTTKSYTTLERYSCGKYYVHPKYIEYLKGHRHCDRGFDIAIIEINGDEINTKKTLKRIKPLNIRSSTSTKTDWNKIKIIGFPSEPQSYDGQLYGMKGLSDFVNARDNQIKYTIDTTYGQSGSPIFRTSNDNNNNDIYSTFGEIIGVHTDGQSIKGYNYGTLINDDIRKWIEKIMQKEGDRNTGESDDDTISEEDREDTIDSLKQQLSQVSLANVGEYFEGGIITFRDIAIGLVDIADKLHEKTTDGQYEISEESKSDNDTNTQQHEMNDDDDSNHNNRKRANIEDTTFQFPPFKKAKVICANCQVTTESTTIIICCECAQNTCCIMCVDSECKKCWRCKKCIN